MSRKVLISTIGSRGEVQSALALALELRALGHQAILCVPPNFRDWSESFGFQCVPIGPDVQKFTAASTQTKRRRPSKAVIRQMVSGSIIEQCKATAIAAQDCDLSLTAGDLQHAGKSIAESLGFLTCTQRIVRSRYVPETTRRRILVGWCVRRHCLGC
jgi:vancomycin aglycone glucosyltransferase